MVPDGPKWSKWPNFKKITFFQKNDPFSKKRPNFKKTTQFQKNDPFLKFKKCPIFTGPDLKGARRTGLSAQRARRTKSSRPEGPKAGPKGRHLEVGARRAPRLLVFYNWSWNNLHLIMLVSHVERKQRHLSLTTLNKMWRRRWQGGGEIEDW